MVRALWTSGKRLADVWQTSGIRLAASGQRLAAVWQTSGSRLARAKKRAPGPRALNTIPLWTTVLASIL
eukprot:5070757-Prymnesium_polylepis.1